LKNEKAPSFAHEEEHLYYPLTTKDGSHHPLR